MHNNMDFIFSQIARNHNTTPEEIRKEITAAMNYAQDNAPPLFRKNGQPFQNKVTY